MTFASQRIAKGNYDERVRVDGVDELAELSDSFNQMAVQLEQVESMRRKLLGDVSHELRTPLTAIKGYMEGLIDGVIPAEPETFLQIHAEADRLSRLVDDLQELSRVESKAYVLDFQPLDISLLVDTAIRRLVIHAREKQIELRSDLPIDLPFVLADTDRITQVLINLIGNAIAYTPVNGSVTISGSWRGDKVKIAVTDTGIGITPEHLPHVFDRFYRVDKSRSRQAGGGSGIGLTIARHLVEAHGGSIWVESAGEGQGSTFIFTMPAAN
jgi:histidine kinase